jgi:ABC-type branched-subunit amino acid transport system substrate-binding protein
VLTEYASSAQVPSRNLSTDPLPPTRTSSADHPLQSGAGYTLQSGIGPNKSRYRLLEEVVLPANQQGNGRAWIAFDVRASRQRFLIRELVFNAQHVEDPQQFVERVAHNLTTLSRQHQGFPAVVETFAVHNVYYIVLQHPAGETLGTLMNRQGGALPEREIAEYGRQVCEMLTVLGRQQPPIVHGGISPDTLMIDQASKKVSLLYVPIFPLKVLPKEKMQSAYVAPEQARGEILPASDIYALAATLHHAMTGFDPRDRLANFYPPVRRLNPTISQSMETLLANGLRLSVAQRISSPTEMQRELTDLIQSLPRPAPAPTALMPPPGSKTRKASPLPRNLLIAGMGALVLILVALLAIPRFLNLGTNASASPSPQATFNQQAALNQQLAAELKAYQQKGIGVSDGRLAFDVYPGRADVSLKKQAATALQQNNMSDAVNALNQAVNDDPIDGEVQIYNENIHILQNKAPSITIAVGLPMDGSDVYLGPARELLQGVYLAQHEANSKNMLPNGLKLRVLIANSGANNADVATVAQFLADRVSKAGNPDRLVGLVGWRTSTQTINARDIIAGVHLPVVAETASSVKLSGSSPYFFRACPSDAIQGQALGKLLNDDLKAKHILVLRDTTDAYSVSLADALASRFQSLGGTFIKDTFTINKTTGDQYQQMIQNLIKEDPAVDTIFLAGFDTDGIRLAHAIGNLARANPANQQLARLKIVGGDALDSVLVLGIGNNEDAATAHNYPEDMRRMLFSTFADFNEWNFQNIPQEKQPSFFANWIATYQSSAMSSNAPTPHYSGLMIYDAVGIYVQAVRLVKGPTITGDAIRDALNSFGKGNIPAYQGVSGRIAFDSRGDPVDKALVILTVQQGKNGNEIVIKQIAGAFR